MVSVICDEPAATACDVQGITSLFVAVVPTVYWSVVRPEWGSVGAVRLTSSCCELPDSVPQLSDALGTGGGDASYRMGPELVCAENIPCPFIARTVTMYNWPSRSVSCAVLWIIVPPIVQSGVRPFGQSRIALSSLTVLVRVPVDTRYW